MAAGESGAAFLEEIARQGRVRIPTITDPRGIDLGKADRLGHTAAMQSLERRLIAALERLGVLMTNTCINYQTILPPTRGEHLAMGDTGVAIYCNSVFGARTNFEGGPSALAAGLPGCRADRPHAALRDAPGRRAAWHAARGRWRRGRKT